MKPEELKASVARVFGGKPLEISWRDYKVQKGGRLVLLGKIVSELRNGSTSGKPATAK